MFYMRGFLMFKSEVAILRSENGRKSPQIRMAKRRRKGALQGYNDRKHYPVWITGYSGNRRMEAATTGFEGSHSDYRKQRLVLCRRVGSIRDFSVWLQKVDSVARVHSSE